MGCEAVECDRNWKHGCSRRRFNFNTDIFDSLENHERKRGQYKRVSIFRYYGLSWSGCLECKNIKFLIVKKYLLNKISLKVKISAHKLILFLRKKKGSFFTACCFDHRLLFLSCLLIISNVFLFFFFVWNLQWETDQADGSNLVLFLFSFGYFQWQLQMFGCLGPLYSKPVDTVWLLNSSIICIYV